MASTNALHTHAKHSRFSTTHGLDEHTIMVGEVVGHSVEDACDVFYGRSTECLSEHCLSAATQAFSRLHLSDIANQKDVIRNSRLYSLLKQSAVSMVERAPWYEGPISLHSHHIVPGSGHSQCSHLNCDPQSWRNGSLIHGVNYEMLWLANHDGRGPFDGHLQTEGIFDAMEAQLVSHQMDLRHNTVRAWIYIPQGFNHAQAHSRLGHPIDARSGSQRGHTGCRFPRR